MNPEDNRLIYIMDYIIQFSTKYAIAQKVLENRSQTFSSLEMTVKSDNSKSLFTNNKLNSYKKQSVLNFC